METSKNEHFATEEKEDHVFTEDVSTLAQRQLNAIDNDKRTKICRRFDMRLLPLATAAYLVAFIDRSNSGNARILGMAADLELTGNRFNIAMSAFYVTYILLEIPANLCCKKFGPRIWISSLVLSFGLISMCIGFCTGYASFIALRVLLGAAEAGIMPGLSYMLCCFYRRHELATRIGIYASCTSLSGAFGGLLATGLSKIPSWGMMHTWRNIFFFEGIITMIVGGLVYLYLPDSPAVSNFLTPDERQEATRIIELETLSSGPSTTIEWRHVKRAFNMANFLLVTANISSLLTVTSMSLFVPSILNAMGFSSIRSQLMSVPAYAVATIVCITLMTMSDRIKHRGLMLLSLYPIGIVGFGLLIGVHSPVGVRYFAVYLAMIPAFTAASTIMAWAIDNSAGPTVRAVSSAIMAGVGNFGGIIATWTYMTKDAPKYITGHAINLGGYVMAFICVLIAVLYLNWENKMRRQGKRDHRLKDATQEMIEDLGHRHPAFVFTL
ncbi:major facilitator superfamily domain-containing protein [Lipomyces arxii]|uniref:major facilitator superfamily domain-containing protein n=1 Tax=Lipomyces arxii TaxID=56418 RepID=UPI0034D00493